MKRHLLALLVLTLSLSAQDRRAYSLRTLTPEEIDQAALGHTRYDFLIAADGGLIDATGSSVRPADLAGYLKQRALEPEAFYFLWTTSTSAPLDTFAPTLKSLGDHGITRIVVRNQVRTITTDKATQPGKDLAKAIKLLADAR